MSRRESFSSSTVFRQSSLNPFSFRLQFGPSFKESFPYIFSENGRFSDLIELAKNTKKEDIKKWGYLFNADVFVENVIRPLYLAKTANVKKEDGEDNILKYLEKFYSSLKKIRHKLNDNLYAPLDAAIEFEEKAKTCEENAKKITFWTSFKIKNVAAPNLDNQDKINKHMDSHLEKTMKFINWLKMRMKEARRDGRPPESYNVVVYSLINDLTYEKIRHKKRKAVIKKDLEFIIFILLWLHFHKQEFEEIQKFIDENKDNPILETIKKLKEDLSKKYSNFRNSQRKEHTPPLQSKIIGLKKITFTDEGYRENWL